MPLIALFAILVPALTGGSSMEKVTRFFGMERRTFWSALRWSAALGLLLVPLIAMQFSAEVNWTAGDFLFAALVIGGAGLAYELAARTVSGSAYRAAVAVAISGAVLIVWANGAVGIAGDEDNPANLLFYAVVAVGFAGAIVTLARPGPMAWVMGTMAVLQVSVGIATSSIDPAVIPATLLFTCAWIVAAGLFHRAARERAGQASGR
jgi:hypothetical protein